jgi:hypothetical protein
MDQILDKMGHWMAIRQALPGRLCSCINPVTDDALPGCSLCLGSGRAYTDRVTKMRMSRPVKITQTLGAEQRTGPIAGSSPDYIFYMDRIIKPTQGDYILELALSDTDLDPIIPFHVVTVYDISDVRELRDLEGRVEYYAVTAERQLFPEFDIGGSS